MTTGTGLTASSPRSYSAPEHGDRALGLGACDGGKAGGGGWVGRRQQALKLD